MPDQDPVAALLAACEPFMRAERDLSANLEPATPLGVLCGHNREAMLLVEDFRRLAEAAARLRAAPDQQKGGAS